MICSTIIPSVNRPSLDRAVKSALDQALALESHEIIVVNDSGEPIDAWDWLRFPQVKIVNTNKTERSVARNVGAALASGKYLHFLDDDDWLLPGGLEPLLDKAELSSCLWFYGALNRVNDNGDILSVNRPTIRGNIFPQLMAGESLHLAPSLINRKAFFRAGGFDPLLSTTEDRDLQIRVALIGNYDFLDLRIANVRVDVGGRSTTDWSRVQHDSRVVREKALDSNGSFPRIREGVQGNVKLRGYCSRALLYSAALNFLAGHYTKAASRSVLLMRLAGIYSVAPMFWRGLLHRSEWHAFEKARVQDHYATNYPAKNVESLGLKSILMNKCKHQ